MRSKRVLRYYCDFCKKSGCSSYHIQRHERGCTNNPDRECGVCQATGVGGATVPELLEAARHGLTALRNAAECCPACMLAGVRALRNELEALARNADEPADPLPPDLSNWDYRAEHRSFWDDVNRDHHSSPLQLPTPYW